MAGLSKQQVDELIRELERDRDAEIAEVVGGIRATYSNAITLLRKRQNSLNSGEVALFDTRPKPAQQNGSVRHDEPRTSRIPGVKDHGGVSQAVREFINVSTGPFTVNDVATQFKTSGRTFKREAIVAALKRLIKSQTIRRTRDGTNHTPAVYDRS